VSLYLNTRFWNTKSGFQGFYYFKEAWNPDLDGALTAFFEAKIATDNFWKRILLSGALHPPGWPTRCMNRP